jgi:hypothetical protein
MLRACALGTYPISSAAARTVSCVALATPAVPERARETTDFETPARAATSWMVGDPSRRLMRGSA